VGYKGLARGRGKAAGNVHPAHGELHGENPEQEQRAQHQSEAEVDPPRPAEVETVVAHPAMIEYPTRQIQRGGDQQREHQRPNKVLIEIWKAPHPTGPHEAIYRGHDKRHHQKDDHAPPGPKAAFLHIPEQTRDWAQGELPIHSCPQNSRVIQAAERLLNSMSQRRVVVDLCFVHRHNFGSWPVAPPGLR